MLGNLIARIRKEKGILKTHLANETRSQHRTLNTY